MQESRERRWRRLWVSVCAAACLAAGAETLRAVEASPGGPWPAEVKGHVPPRPGEHPRLLFRRSDLPTLRARAKTPQGRAIVRRLRALLCGGDGLAVPAEIPVKTYTISHTAGFQLPSNNTSMP